MSTIAVKFHFIFQSAVHRSEYFTYSLSNKCLVSLSYGIVHRAREEFYLVITAPGIPCDPLVQFDDSIEMQANLIQLTGKSFTSYVAAMKIYLK